MHSSFRNWGFSSLQIDGTGLSEGQLNVSQASGVFPDGLMLDMPASDAPPRSRTLDECFHDGNNRCAFYLAIPQDRPGGINIGLQRGGISTRFYSELQMLRDENSSGIEKPVSLARKNLQILAEGENLEGSVLLPLAQIERTEAGGYRLDAKYVPPMLNVKGNELLTGILRGLIETLVSQEQPARRRPPPAQPVSRRLQRLGRRQLLASLHDQHPPSCPAPFAGNRSGSSGNAVSADALARRRAHHLFAEDGAARPAEVRARSNWGRASSRSMP